MSKLLGGLRFEDLPNERGVQLRITSVILVASAKELRVHK